MNDFESEIKLGIELHRHIDDFTDNHDVVLESKKRLRPTYRHYSPVIVDLYYDHFLGKFWRDYSEIELSIFTEDFYKSTRQYGSIIPEKAKNMLFYMEKDNWLLNYQHMEGIQKALSGMARRTPFNSKMEKSIKDLELHYDFFQQEFKDFFPSLQESCAQFLKDKHG